MNTYNENLRAGVANSLQKLEQDLKKAGAESNAAMFSLYYAEGATITSKVKLDTAKAEQSSAEFIKGKAVRNANLSVNLQASAGNSSQYLKQSVTNIATAASGMQLAANAILKLSSDIGSINNIITAADYGTEIYNHATEANKLINDTAYDAELASQLAMETSAAAAAVSGTAMLAKANAENNTMNDLLTALSANYDAISKTVSADNEAAAAESATEKKAEGNYDDLSILEEATQKAYMTTNETLNQNLVAVPAPGNQSTRFQVSFDPVKLPLFRDSGISSDSSKGAAANFYPVSNYYLFVVPENQKSQFSIATAESIISQNYTERFINVNMQFLQLEQPGNTTLKPLVFDCLEIPGPGNKTYQLKDPDNNDITTGVNYVVFLMAVYDEKYKKKLNIFDDFLSAPSAPFCLTIALEKAKIRTGSGTDPVDTVTFTVAKTAEAVEYRCIFLPLSNNPSESGMTTAETQADLENEIISLQKIAKELDPEISTQETKIADINASISDIKEKHKDLITVQEALFSSGTSRPRPAKFAVTAASATRSFATKILNDSSLSDKDKKAASSYFIFRADKILAEVELNKLKAKKQEALINLARSQQNRIGFLFNMAIAAQVPAGSYERATPKEADKEKPSASNVRTLPEQTWEVKITADTTDNFGNLLTRYDKNAADGKQKSYLPVILSVSAADEQNQSKYSINWTGYADSPILIFK